VIPIMSHEVERELNPESPEGRKDNRDFADKVKCPICGEMFEQDSLKPDDVPSDQSAHLKALEHHGSEHPNKSWKGVVSVKNRSWSKKEVDRS